MASSPHRLGLSLSGGGYRATAFHLGTLNKLQEMNILQQADVISTISGGSVIGAYYCLQKDDYNNFSQSLYSGVQQKNVIKKVLFSFTALKLLVFALIFLIPAFYFLFTPYAWLFPVLISTFIFLLLKFQFHIFPVSKKIEDIYNDFFYAGKKLGELPEYPALVIGSTNLQTARPFTFSRNWMQDSTYQYRKPQVKFIANDFPVARAVMASSCVPFAFTPIKIDKQYFQDPSLAKDVHPLLVDGGVYDNQGIHKIMQHGSYECMHVITSDAGGGSSGELSIRNTIALLISTVDVFMSRIKKAQMVQDIYGNTATSKKQIAYLSLAWDIEECIPGFIDNLADGHISQSVIDAHQLEQKWVDEPRKYETEITAWLEKRTGYAAIKKPSAEEKKIARRVGTNLTSLSKLQVDCLMLQASCLTELQVKLYCPSLIK
jgi:NTE family protein